MDAGRKHDIAELTTALKTETDPVARKGAKDSLAKIRKEQGNTRLRGLRAKMIEERLRGKQGNVREVQDAMIGVPSNEYSHAIFTWPEGEWERIYGNKK